MVKGLRVQGLGLKGLRVQGLRVYGFRVQGLGVQGVQGMSGVQGSELRVTVQSLCSFCQTLADMLRLQHSVENGFSERAYGSMVTQRLIPYPFLGYLVLRLRSAILKSRRPKIGVGYEPLGTWLASNTEPKLSMTTVPLMVEVLVIMVRLMDKILHYPL